jgi:SAM-dependent methyltransferase
MESFNCYEDPVRAEAYSTLGFANTYYLAFRDLPALFRRHTRGAAALDFGCGTGRSARFLRDLGYRVVGIDIAEDMVRIARRLDPSGDYRIVDDGEVGRFPAESFDLILSAFTFDNIPEAARKVRLLRPLGRVLSRDGCLVNLVSSPEIYLHEWASFSTADFPDNRLASTGDIVRIITVDFADRRPCLDVLFPDEAYRELYDAAELEVVEVSAPLADGSEPYPWKSETCIAPWVIYALKQKQG